MKLWTWHLPVAANASDWAEWRSLLPVAAKALLGQSGAVCCGLQPRLCLGRAALHLPVADNVPDCAERRCVLFLREFHG